MELKKEVVRDASTYKDFLRQVLKPSIKKFPTRYILEPRSLPIFRICRRDKLFKKHLWHQITEEALKALKKTPEKPLRDEISIKFLEDELNKA
jgi:hypothetical protein